MLSKAKMQSIIRTGSLCVIVYFFSNWQNFGLSYLVVDATKQQMLLLKGKEILTSYPISTAEKGLGEEKNSFQTPRGLMVINSKFGTSKPLYSVFVARVATGEIYNEELKNRYPNRDWILSRIMWLSGLEPGRNSFGKYDTMERKIYIHGAPPEYPMGIPLSHGCIRMNNIDVVDLFDRVSVGTKLVVMEEL